MSCSYILVLFFFNDTATTEIYTLSPTRRSSDLGNALQKYVMENTRLGIPLFLAEEAPHGHMAIGTTVFPTGLGMAATWNPELIEQVGRIIAKEIRLQGGHIKIGRAHV